MNGPSVTVTIVRFNVQYCKRLRWGTIEGFRWKRAIITPSEIRRHETPAPPCPPYDLSVGNLPLFFQLSPASRLETRQLSAHMMHFRLLAPVEHKIIISASVPSLDSSGCVGLCWH